MKRFWDRSIYHLDGSLTDEFPLGAKEARGECDVDRRYIKFGSWGSMRKVEVKDLNYAAGFRYSIEFKPSKKLTDFLNRVSYLIVGTASSMFLHLYFLLLLNFR